MENTQDIRWKQRFQNYEKALNRLKEAIEKSETFNDNEQKNDLDFFDIIKSGVIKSFEYTYELAWNVMKDYAASQGFLEPKSPKAAIREAFRIGLIQKYEIWSDVLQSRNKTSHTYDDEIANEVFFDIKDKYFSEFQIFYNVMKIKFIEDKLNVGLSEIQIEKIKTVFAKYPEIDSAIIFGSRAKGNYKYNSDIDIALKGENASTVSGDIAFDLEDLNFPNDFDLKVFNTISNQELVEHINRVGIAIYVKQ
jgi:nucleotidyltransferase substrate binding protein (TIGR01987 family)